jgi:hypothetical protein
VLAVWCVATALIAHTKFADRNQEIHFLKNLAMRADFFTSRRSALARGVSMYGGCTAIVSFSVVPARIRRHRLSDKGDGRFESCPLAGESTANLTSSVMHIRFVH